MQMLDAARTGTVRGLWVVGWDILQTQPNLAATDAALASLDTLVVQDLFLNETAAAHATIFLPACSSFEKDGTFMNGERRIQRVRRALEPIGDSKPDWEITCLAARAMGHTDAFDFRRPERHLGRDPTGLARRRRHQLRTARHPRRPPVAVPQRRTPRHPHPAHHRIRRARTKGHTPHHRLPPHTRKHRPRIPVRAHHRSHTRPIQRGHHDPPLPHPRPAPDRRARDLTDRRRHTRRRQR